MGRGFRIGRIVGIDLRVDPSWLIIFMLLIWSLSSTFAAWHPEWTGWTSLVVAVLASVLFFGSVLFHELAHSLVARGYGLPVRDITLFMFGGVSNIEREPPTPRAELAIAIVGPLASFGLGIMAILLVGLSVAWNGAITSADDAAAAVTHLGPLVTLLLWLGPVNIAVGLFNLIPGFPLDGGRVLRAAIWKVTGDPTRATRIAGGVGQVVGVAFIAAGVLMALGVHIPLLGTGLVSGLWLALIGMFLRGAAVQSQLGAVLREALGGLRVGDLMRSQYLWVDGRLPLRTLVEGWFLRREERAFPVFDDERFVGLVCLDDVRRIDAASWDERHVVDVMTPAARLVTAEPEEALIDAMGKLASGNVGQLPVVRDGKLLGVLVERDVARWLELESTTRHTPQRPRESHA